MDSKYLKSAFFLLLLFAFCSCSKEGKRQEGYWKTLLQEKMSLMGHRNWIVVTDMAYPLQTNPGISTICTDEPYEEVLNFVRQEINKAPHVYPHVYQDLELSYLQEDLCPGIDMFRHRVNNILASDKIRQVAHEELISRLDSVCDLFQVIIIKTTMTKPYTSVFFELDCKYWDARKQGILQKNMSNR